MKAEVHGGQETSPVMKFLILKSNDGGKNWVRERHRADFVAAADAAQALRGGYPSIRFRVDVDADQRGAGRRKRCRA